METVPKMFKTGVVILKKTVYGTKYNGRKFGLLSRLEELHNAVIMLFRLQTLCMEPKQKTYWEYLRNFLTS